MLDAGHKMPAGSLTRPREIFFKKCAGGIDNRPALGIEARRAGRATCQMHSALRSFGYAQDKLMPREPAPATDRKWIPAFSPKRITLLWQQVAKYRIAGMTKCGRERPELNNVSRAAVDQRDSIHNARLIPPCIIGKRRSCFGNFPMQGDSANVFLEK